MLFNKTLSLGKSAKLDSGFPLIWEKKESSSSLGGLGLFKGAGGLDGGVPFGDLAGDFGLPGGAGLFGRGGTGDLGLEGGAPPLLFFCWGGREGRAGFAPGGANAPWPNGSSGWKGMDGWMEGNTRKLMNKELTLIGDFTSVTKPIANGSFWAAEIF